MAETPPPTVPWRVQAQNIHRSRVGPERQQAPHRVALPRLRVGVDLVLDGVSGREFPLAGYDVLQDDQDRLGFQAIAVDAVIVERTDG
jgi:hypothetical protein